MGDASWSLVDVTAPADDAELVSDALWAMGVVAIEEFVRPDGTVTLRTSMGDDPVGFVTRVHTAFPGLGVSIVEMDRSVADTWRLHAVPTRVNDDVWLVPAWCDPPPGSRSVIVEPLDTFGLGNHPTTVLTLRLALAHVAPESLVFDLGSGSGVLAVAMATLHGCRVFATDIAESARGALVANAELNGATSCIWIDGFPREEVDAVLSNILAPVLESESRRVTECVRTGGTVVLSGMRDEQVDRVLAHYHDFEEIERTSLDGWSAVALRRRVVRR